MATVNLYRGSSGINNRLPAELLPYDPDSGVAGLQQADNVLIGEAGQLYTRGGSRQVFSDESCHSAFPVPGGFLFVQERDSAAVVCSAFPDSSGQLAISDIGSLHYPGSWLSWLELDNEFWFSTARERWIITADMKPKAWPVCTPQMVDDTDNEYAALPFGRHIEQHSMFTLSAVGDTVYASEAGFPTLFRVATEAYRVEGPVRLVQSVQSGVFVSNEKAVWFLSGLNPREWQARRVLNYPAIEYCKLHGLVSAADLGFDSGSLGVVFMTVNGPVFGFEDGTVINLTDKQFAMPQECKFSKGSMMLVNKSNLIISVN